MQTVFRSIARDCGIRRKGGDYRGIDKGRRRLSEINAQTDAGGQVEMVCYSRCQWVI